MIATKRPALREWNDKTDDWQSRPFSEHVSDAISVLRCG